MLCDTGPLVALIDRMDPYHARCVKALDSLPVAAFVTTWPCLTEAMYLLRRAGGSDAQDELWGYLADGFVLLDLPGPDDWRRVQELVSQYKDLPLDIADASLVVTAERLRDWRLFSLDQRLRAIHLDSQRWLEVVP
jgi:predicted nucleic acid-binding protein